MRILGLDMGEKRIGVAVSDKLKLTAQSMKVLSYESDEQLIDNLKGIVCECEIEKIVIGLPLDMDGKTGDQAGKVLNFKEKLQAELDIPVLTWDERLSTVSAERSLIDSGMRRKRRKKVVDKVAASIILQSYLDKVSRTG